MGFLDFLTGKGGLDRTIKTANNKNAQSPDRFHALEKLRDDGTEEAIGGLLRRFTFSADKSIEDQDEKNWTYDALVELATHEVKPGDSDEERTLKLELKQRVLHQIGKALAAYDTIAWALRVLSAVATRDEAWPILEKAVADNDPGYVRDPSKKIQLIDYLGEGFDDERASHALLQYLDDVDETVRFHAIEALFHHGNEEVAREPLLQRLVSDDEDSRRIKLRVLDGLADLGWNTHGHKGQVDAVIAQLSSAHSIDGKGRIKKPQK